MSKQEALPSMFSRDWRRRVRESFILACRDFFVDNGPNWAAAVAFYGVLSIFPLLLAALSIASQLVDQQWAAAQLTRWLGDFVPAGEEELARIVREAQQAGAGTGFVSMLLLLWSGSYVFGAMTTALNLAYDVDEVYGFWMRMLVRFAMLLTVGLMLLLAVVTPLVLALVRTLAEALLGESMPLINFANLIVPPVLLLIAFFLVYRFVPRKRLKWSAALTGAVIATALFLLARPLFLGYLGTFTGFNVIYGTLAAAIVLLFWAWIFASILLFGGEVSAHIQALVIEGKPLEEVREKYLQRSPDRKEATVRSRSHF
jgi:membrane protein